MRYKSHIAYRNNIETLCGGEIRDTTTVFYIPIDKAVLEEKMMCKRCKVYGERKGKEIIDHSK